MPEQEKEGFESWAIVELFGHNRIAGKVSEASIGGCSFIRVDVPNDEGEGFRFTRYFGNGAIYALNPVEEKVARVAAMNISAAPVNVYNMKQELEAYDKAHPKLEHGIADENDHFEYGKSTWGEDQ